MSSEFVVRLEEGERVIKVEPFIFDVRAQKLYCPWCHSGMRFRVTHETVFDFVASMSVHIKEKHPDKHEGVPLGILLAEVNP